MNLQQYYHGLNSERLYLRKLTHEDIPSWTEFYENNPNLKYLDIDLNRTNVAMATAWVDTQINRYDKNEFGQLGIILKATDELVGTVGFLMNEKCAADELAQAIIIKPPYWNHGIAWEASVLILNANFEHNWASSIFGFRHKDNILSQRFSQKLGFKDTEVIEEKNRTTIKFELTKEMWKHNFN
ncbi:MAG: GNAT family N-acetyltransferase [Saprospiraceae bacterium]|nr:GNAT family N-acetyltransferase [Saprospiraceae bacterium]